MKYDTKQDKQLKCHYLDDDRNTIMMNEFIHILARNQVEAAQGRHGFCHNTKDISIRQTQRG